MFSSLNSVRRNCLKQPRPAALFITFSNDDDQDRASSSVGRRLGGERATNQRCLIHSAHPRLTQHVAEVFHYLSSQFMVPSDRCSQADLWTASSSLLTVRLRGEMHRLHQQVHFINRKSSSVIPKIHIILTLKMTLGWPCRLFVPSENNSQSRYWNI